MEINDENLKSPPRERWAVS